MLTESDLPTREECGRVYRILRGYLGFGRSDLISPRLLLAREDGYLQLLITLALLSQAGLLTVRGEGPFTIVLPKTDQKVDLTALPLWKRLHERCND